MRCLRRRRDGALQFSGLLLGAGAELAAEEFDALSGRAGPDDTRSLALRQAEVLLELCAQAVSPTGIATDQRTADQTDRADEKLDLNDDEPEDRLDLDDSDAQDADLDADAQDDDQDDDPGPENSDLEHGPSARPSTARPTPARLMTPPPPVARPVTGGSRPG